MRAELWTLGPRVAQVEWRAPRGAQPKSWATHGRRSRLAKKVMKELRRVWRSDCPGWQSDRLPLFHGRSVHLGSWSNGQPLFRGRSDRQPLFYGRSDRLGSWLDRQPLFHVRSDRLGSRSDRQ
jgi:hypothetical protein